MKEDAVHVIPIIASLVVAIAPHVPGLPLWITAWCLVMWGYMLVQLKTNWPLPNTLVRYGLAFTGILGLLLTYNVRIGADAFIGLLALMAAIKPFEMTTHRHQMITVLLTYFIIITSLFRSDSMFIVLYMFFSVFVTTIALIRINSPQDRFKNSLKLAGKILAQAIPLMILLFLLFPRLPASLFGIQDKTRGKTGFSDSLSPGSVASLVQDPRTAFRVDFTGQTPSTDQLYWRGIVFQEFDGNTWTPGKLPVQSSPSLVPRGELYSYTLILEPHNSVWLFSLDRPVKGPSWADLTPEFVLKSRRPIKKRIQYTATSIAGDDFDKTATPDPAPNRMPEQTLSGKMAAAIIFKAENTNPRARALALKLARNAVSPIQKSHILLTYFRENQFVYTLNPPLAKAHPVDDFVFESRKGYCEHFASAFAFMMNALDVPARIVGGYLGGELNPYGNYLTIRNSYAHAWVEIFDASKGWIRVDPTAAVAPERIGTNPDGSSASFGATDGMLSFSRKIKFALEAANLQWEAWFTGYSYFEQKALLEKIGLGNWGGAAGTFLVLVLLCLVILAGFSGLALWWLHSKKNTPDPVQASYSRFCSRLGKLGLNRRPDQGPIDFATACARTRPDLQEEIQRITLLYVQLRFQKDCPDTALGDFKARIAVFKPKPALPKDCSH